jgi:hypothetical protein
MSKRTHRRFMYCCVTVYLHVDKPNHKFGGKPTLLFGDIRTRSCAARCAISLHTTLGTCSPLVPNIQRGKLLQLGPCGGTFASRASCALAAASAIVTLHILQIANAGLLLRCMPLRITIPRSDLARLCSSIQPEPHSLARLHRADPFTH